MIVPPLNSRARTAISDWNPGGMLPLRTKTISIQLMPPGLVTFTSTLAVFEMFAPGRPESSQPGARALAFALYNLELR